MLFLILTPIIISIVVFTISNNNKILNTFLGFTVGLTIGVIISATLSMILPSTTKIEKKFEVELVSFNDRIANISGNFFLGIGSIENEDYYYFYYKYNENVFKLNKILCNNASLSYTNEQPVLIGYKETEFGKGIFKYLTLPKSDNIYRFYVPKGTVKNSFNADLK